MDNAGVARRPFGTIIEPPNDEKQALMEALCDGLGDRTWCRQKPFSLTDDERLNFSWDEFCDLVKYHRRYFFLGGVREDSELHSPLALLKELATWCERYDLIKPLPANSHLYRARFEEPHEVWSTAADLGPPPQEKAIQSRGARLQMRRRHGARPSVRGSQSVAQSVGAAERAEDLGRGPWQTHWP
jgi:hypothetical protein